MDSARDTRALPRVGFPIRRSRGQRLVSTSPGLIAAAHVLHRLSAPRHPPCALVLLIEKNTFHHYGVFKVRADQELMRACPSKLNSVERRGRRSSRRSRTSDDLLAFEPASHRRAVCTTGVRAPG